MKERWGTQVFEFGEKEKSEKLYSSSFIDIKYCSYCGEKAKVEDIGETHNHRWEEEIIHFCKCEKAQQEKLLKEELAEINNKKFHLERELSNLQKSEEESLKTREIKAKIEIEFVKKKYNL